MAPFKVPPKQIVFLLKIFNLKYACKVDDHDL